MRTIEANTGSPRQAEAVPPRTVPQPREATKSEIKVDRDPPYVLDYSLLPPNADDWFPEDESPTPIIGSISGPDAMTNMLVERHRRSDPKPSTVFEALSVMRDLHAKDPYMTMHPRR